MPLEVVNLQLTSRCNLQCACCRRVPHDTTMSRVDWLALVDDLAVVGVERVQLSGGEPLLCDYLEELIEALTAIGATTALSSNGVLLTRERAVRLREAGLADVCVSTPYGSSGARAPAPDAERALDNATAAGFEPFASLVASRSDAPHLKPAIEALIRRGVTRFNILRPQPSHDPGWLQTERLDARGLTSLVRDVVRLGIRHRVRMNLDCALVGAAMLVPGFADHATGCRAGVSAATIGPGGGLFPCTHLQQPQHRAGNVQQTRLAYLWRQPGPWPELRCEPTGQPCSDCRFREACRGCRAMAFAATGNATAGDPDCPYGSASLPGRVVAAARMVGTGALAAATGASQRPGR